MPAATSTRRRNPTVLLRAYRGAFVDDYTPVSAAKLLSRLTTITGLELALGWAKREGHEFSGDSDLYVLQRDTVLEAPAALMGLLLDPEFPEDEITAMLEAITLPYTGTRLGRRVPDATNRYNFVFDV